MSNEKTSKFDKNIILFIDGNYLAFKSYFPREDYDKAIKGFLNASFRLKQRSNAGKVVVSFDHNSRNNFRYQYSWYKKSRKNAKHKTDQFYLRLLEELPKILRERGIIVNHSPEYEADDLIGISSKFYSKKRKKVVIYTGDKDLLQLVDDYIEVWRPLKGTTKQLEINDMKNFKKLNDGFVPSQLRDLKGLLGDRSDNIPGITGLDYDISKELMKKYGNFKNIYDNLEKIDEKVRKKLINKEKIARISLKVGTIITTSKSK